MKIFQKNILLLIILTILTSCTKVIDLKLGNNTGKLVIEGNLTNVTGLQTIKLSQNVSVSATNTFPPVTGATVTVNDPAGRNYTFIEGPAGSYTNSSLTGTAGNSYTMMVIADAKNYQASSVMPTAVVLDSLTYKDEPVNTSKHKKVLTVHYLDPAGITNQYRFIIWINNIQVKTIYAFNDDFNDGRYVSLDLRVRDNDDTDYGVYAGDKVTVEMQCLDKTIYTYWYTLMQQASNGPGGGVTPVDPPSNITPTVLGYFSAHTTQSQTIIIK